MSKEKTIKQRLAEVEESVRKNEAMARCIDEGHLYEFQAVRRRLNTSIFEIRWKCIRCEHLEVRDTSFLERRALSRLGLLV